MTMNLDRADLLQGSFLRNSEASPGNRHFRMAQHRQAFTLLEILLAVAIFSIVLAAISSVFASALRLHISTSRNLEEAAPLDLALNVMRRDLQGAVPPGGAL